MIKPDIRDFTRQELAGAMIAMGEKGSRADKIFNCLYRKGAGGFEAMSCFTDEFRAKLAERYSLAPLPCVEKLVSKIDGTIKLVFRFRSASLNDSYAGPGSFEAPGAKENRSAPLSNSYAGPVVAESVLMFNKETVTACLSSQSGCACGCGFCATGALGLTRDLKPSEIIGQFAACAGPEGRAPDRLVFMGMGEPFLNWANVKKSILILSDNKGCNFPQQKITVSTVGVVPVIRELADSRLGVRLAVSVITADEKQRAELTPMEKKYPLREIIAAARYYCSKTGKSVFFEYIFFDGLNDSPQDAQKFIDLIKGVECKVNLIMYNPGPAGKAGLTPGRMEKAKEFQKIMMAAGIRTHLRRERGSDICAACGQLGSRAGTP